MTQPQRPSPEPFSETVVNYRPTASTRPARPTGQFNRTAEPPTFSETIAETTPNPQAPNPTPNLRSFAQNLRSSAGSEPSAPSFGASFFYLSFFPSAVAGSSTIASSPTFKPPPKKSRSSFLPNTTPSTKRSSTHYKLPKTKRAFKPKTNSTNGLKN